MVIGGNSKYCKFNEKDANLLVEILFKINIDNSFNLFISFSRRTSYLVKQVFKDNFASNCIYDPEDNSNLENPYVSLLDKSNYVITTADSISICSEVASSSKPLYIFFPNKLKSRKHRDFFNYLINLGIARKLDKETKYLENYCYKPLNEVQKVVNVIEDKILNINLEGFKNKN